ncbi:Hypothetical predicted protein [Olea europaea subsp. europaea]|uniref:Uncharacterized protein n=1 Tax=Olea europaea subsp. europaea TaxID=158383 RepID=A0A8S0SAJ5_OLEEU|nr:Hypothetical predicted protein [Olea europaea subsp. europaea]
MDIYEIFSFLVIIKESIKLLPKNGKLMALIVVLSLVFYSISFLLLSFSLKSLLLDVFVIIKNSFVPDRSSFDPDQSPFTPNTTSPLIRLLGQVDHLREDFTLFLSVQMAFYIASFIFSIFSTTATVLLSAMSYKNQTLFLKDLCFRIVKTWKRVFLTGFYTKLHSIGYLFLFLSLVAPLLMSGNYATILAAFLLGISASVYSLYLAVVWTLAIMVSALEENCYGMEALGKAATIVKGKKLHGIMLIICYNLLFLSVYLGYSRIQGNKGTFNSTIYGNLLVLIISSLGKTLLDMAYTVLYFQCKENHGEEIELYGSVEYTKLPTTQPLNK